MYLHPGARAVSEFARQSNGTYLHATCVETATYAIELAMTHPDLLPANLVGNYLESLVQQWQAHNPSIGAQGASSWSDATWWMQTHDGYHVIGDIHTGTMTDINEMRLNIPRGYVYLVGTCNAQALHGGVVGQSWSGTDEAGVQCHGFAAVGVDDAGNIICADPDNSATQSNMPGNPYGYLVSYTPDVLVNQAGITSLTKVYPMPTVPSGWSDDGSTLKPPIATTAYVFHSGFRWAILNSLEVFGFYWDSTDIPLENERSVTPVEVSNPALNGGTGVRQYTRQHLLEWYPSVTANNGVVLGSVGQEAFYLTQHQGPTVNVGAIKAAAEQIVSLVS